MIDKFYSISTISYPKHLKVWHTKTHGFFKTFKEAERILLLNSEMIYENDGQHALIESVTFGLLSHNQDPIIWYEYNEEMFLYQTIECPNEDFKFTHKFWS